jgi:chemotaxis response regulator CheB
VITVFLKSLAQHWNGKVVAVIVSGLDGDGAEALSGIRDAGGITIAQRLETAQVPDMPASAIGSGFVDFVLSPEEIARKIVSIAGAEAAAN